MIKIKIFINKIFALLILLLLSPLIILISIAIVIDDGFPVFFVQKRVGRNNKLFHIYKFRTMSKKTGNIPTHLLDKNKITFTKIGPYLRKISLDELPQLLNIIFGQMLFIGPRPALYNQHDLIDLRSKMNIHKMYPGITGWAQINGRDEITILKKVELEKYYLENKSMSLDLKILLKTIAIVIKSKNISH